MATGAAALLALAACSETVGEAALGVATGHDVEIEEDGASVSYRTADGEVTITGGEAAALPGDFPGDVFVPEAYVVESTLAMNDDLFVALAVHQDVPALYAAAREGMAGHGWTETMAALENDGNGLLTFEKDDRSAVLSMARADAGATLGLQLTRMAP
jgi:hypothetical protein